MLKAIKELLVGTRAMSANPTASISASQHPVGYFMPASAEQLLSTASRQQCLQQLWENSALPKDLYEHFYLQPLKQLVTLMQVLPAASQGSMPGKEGWSMLPCRRRLMRFDWPRDTCCPRGRARRTIRPECAVECRGVLCSAMALPAAVEPAAGRVPKWPHLVTWLDGAG